MVVTRLPRTADTGVTQARVATPSTCTVQAPHWATPQPYLVPVRPTCSRMTHRSGVFGSTSTFWDLPLTTRRIIRRSPGGAGIGAAEVDANVGAYCMSPARRDQEFIRYCAAAASVPPSLQPGD